MENMTKYCSFNNPCKASGQIKYASSYFPYGEISMSFKAPTSNPDQQTIIKVDRVGKKISTIASAFITRAFVVFSLNQQDHGCRHPHTLVCQGLLTHTVYLLGLTFVKTTQRSPYSMYRNSWQLENMPSYKNLQTYIFQSNEEPFEVCMALFFRVCCIDRICTHTKL